MKNRTVYEVLEEVMRNYSYTIEKNGKKVTLTGKVYIERIDETVTHEKTVFQVGDGNDERELENVIRSFKDGLRSKVAEVIKSHAEELTDDEAMIDKLLYEVKKLTEELQRTKEELASANQRIGQLELEKYAQPCQPYPWTTTPNTRPWDNPNPWVTGITWETQIGDPPGWLDKNSITCSASDSDMETSVSYNDYNDWKDYTSALDSDFRDRLKGTSERYG